MGGSSACEQARFCFHHHAESIASQRALLLEIASDFREALVGDGFLQKAPIRRGAFLRRVTQRQIPFVPLQGGVGANSCVDRTA